MCSTSLSALSCKCGFNQSFDSCMNTKKVSSPGLLFPLLFFKTPRGGCDKEFIQILAAKCKRDNVLHRETNLAFDFAIGSVAGEFSPIPVPVPDKALGIHDKTVGHPFFFRNAGKDTATVGRPLSRLIVQSDDLPFSLISHVDRTTIQA